MKSLKSISIALILVIITISFSSLSASAATASYPAISTSKPLKTYAISTGNTTPAYGSKSTSNRIGYIYGTDEIYVTSISGEWAYCTYPVSGGRKAAYIKLSVITGATGTSFTTSTARAQVTAYRRSNTNNTYGYVSKGDLVHKITTSGSFTQIIYPISDGWKMAWVKTTDYDNNIKEVHTHSYGSWVVTKAATCTAAGSRYRKCSCGATETQTLPALGHSYGSWIVTKDATCTVAGSRYRKCSCGATETQTLPTLGHSWGSWIVTKEATTTATGSKYRQCSRCGVKETAIIDKLVSSTWQYPLKGAKCSWKDGGSTWSWSQEIDGKPNATTRTFHLGLDLKGSSTTVYPALDGTVSACSSSNAGANGRYVVIKHNFGGKTIYSFYAHLSSVKVNTGDKVTKNTEIGIMGGSGYGRNDYYGPHLHFAIVDTLLTGGGYYGYAYKFSGNVKTYGDVTFYNPKYVIDNNKLP